MNLHRRAFSTGLLCLPLAQALPAQAQSADVWPAQRAWDALNADDIRMIDVRARSEWAATGVAAQAWPISMHENRFSDRLFAARDLAGERQIALICATGGRSGYIQRSLRKAGYTGFIDVSEGMLGSDLGVGWIAAGLPVVPLDDALAALPPALL
ncbi:MULTISPECIES: rhodanese-like domain-containing protein [Marinovum]|jgi:rhodanese-related sulfurtransferase|uniref:rhodanese-like domain-containing protein n=1 Tax=Marinovum TaxID=367771 RepID=UPI00237BDE4A|nr:MULTISPECIES: rhodanese-like domain-containing protein [Marinovum]MDD9744007.1 rhodanese-like domain-containing protein [Marinovum sp. PR37]